MSEKLHSNFWLNKDILQNIFEANNVLGYILYKKIISNYVNIIANEDLEITFSDDEKNQTNGKTITISSKLDFDKFDVNIGVALHEASHIRLTDFTKLLDFSRKIPLDLYDIRRHKNIGIDIFEKFCFLVFNYIEDKFIDDYIYTNFLGYRPYYIAMYNEYFNSEVVTKILESDYYRKSDLNSYEFRLINLSNEKSDYLALPKLKEIYDLINYKNISRLKKIEDRLNLSFDISKVILQEISVCKGEKNYSLFNKSEIKIDEGKEVDNKENEVPESINKLKDNQKRLINGELRKSTISKDVKSQIDSLQNCDIHYKLIGDGTDKIPNVPCIIIERITKEYLMSLEDKITLRLENKNNEKFINRGICRGDLLYNKVKFFPEILQEIMQNKNSGKLDKKKLYSAEFNENIFYKKEGASKERKIFVHISIDASGSMDGIKWEQTIVFVMSLARLFSKIKLVDYIVSFRETTKSKTSSYPLLTIGFDSKKDNFEKLKDLFRYTIPHSSTPEGLCFQAMGKYFDDSCPNYLINISDGAPCYKFPNGKVYSGKSAAMHTKKQIEMLLRKGIHVFSYFIYDKNENNGKEISYITSFLFKIMYEKHGYLIDTDQLTQVSESLTKEFYKKLLDQL